MHPPTARAVTWKYNTVNVIISYLPLTNGSIYNVFCSGEQCNPSQNLYSTYMLVLLIFHSSCLEYFTWGTSFCSLDWDFTLSSWLSCHPFYDTCFWHQI